MCIRDRGWKSAVLDCLVITAHFAWNCMFKIPVVVNVRSEKARGSEANGYFAGLYRVTRDIRSTACPYQRDLARTDSGNSSNIYVRLSAV